MSSGLPAGFAAGASGPAPPAAGSASAATTRQLESQITEANGAALHNPTGLAVDSTGHLFVSDAGAGAIDKFDSLGATA